MGRNFRNERILRIQSGAGGIEKVAVVCALIRRKEWVSACVVWLKTTDRGVNGTNVEDRKHKGFAVCQTCGDRVRPSMLLIVSAMDRTRQFINQINLTVHLHCLEQMSIIRKKWIQFASSNAKFSGKRFPDIVTTSVLPSYQDLNGGNNVDVQNFAF